jgi:hypothetical protein
MFFSNKNIYIDVNRIQYKLYWLEEVGIGERCLPAETALYVR